MPAPLESLANFVRTLQTGWRVRRSISRSAIFSRKVFDQKFQSKRREANAVGGGCLLGSNKFIQPQIMTYEFLIDGRGGAWAKLPVTYLDLKVRRLVYWHVLRSAKPHTILFCTTAQHASKIQAYWVALWRWQFSNYSLLCLQRAAHSYVGSFQNMRQLIPKSDLNVALPRRRFAYFVITGDIAHSMMLPNPLLDMLRHFYDTQRTYLLLDSSAYDKSAESYAGPQETCIYPKKHGSRPSSCSCMNSP